MIGLAVQAAEKAAATEFFELLKTPWEFFRPDGRYDVLISTGEPVDCSQARLIVVSSGDLTQFDRENKIIVKTQTGGVCTCRGNQLPLYGPVAIFPERKDGILRETTSRQAIAFRAKGRTTVLRVGYNLFAESSLLLGQGQPAQNADTPTLEMHLALLREWVTRAGLPLVEIPPVPDGYNFMTCLTHDVDHPILRNHWCDATMLGFLYRSSLGSLVEVCQGKQPVDYLLQNWSAVGRLPFVYAGLAKDFWRNNFDRYLEIESKRGSTYFVIPRSGYAGRNGHGSAPGRRACRYDVEELLPQLRQVLASGNEVALHGLDAWMDAEAGREERERITPATGQTEIGVRMHWLFYNGDSAAILDQAGFSYDSSVGYNETVGCRAGTLQAYRPLGAKNLLELPLHVMDTALFYPCYLNLEESAAQRRVWQLLDHAQAFGGAFTVNWHDRSIAPERLWERFYRKLLQELERRGAWFPTASQAVSWFRKRRSTTIEADQVTGRIHVKARVGSPDLLPGLRVRVHKPEADGFEKLANERVTPEFVDAPLYENTEFSIAI
jgi:hypothetical protein